MNLVFLRFRVRVRLSAALIRPTIVALIAYTAGSPDEHETGFALGFE
jgi:hypothetical protein